MYGSSMDDTLFTDRPAIGRGALSIVIAFPVIVLVAVAVAALSAALRDQSTIAVVSLGGVAVLFLAIASVLIMSLRSVEYRITSRSVALRAGFLATEVPLENIREIRGY